MTLTFPWRPSAPWSAGTTDVQVRSVWRGTLIQRAHEDHDEKASPGRSGSPAELAAVVGEVLRRYSGAERVSFLWLFEPSAEPRAVTLEVGTGQESLEGWRDRVNDRLTGGDAYGEGDGFPPFPLCLGPPETGVSPPPGVRIVVSLEAEGDHRRVVLAYDPRFLSEDVAAALGVRTEDLLEKAWRISDRPLGDFELVTEAEGELLLGAWAGESYPYPRDAHIVDLLRGVAEAKPEAVALETSAGLVTYRELLHRVGMLHATLREAGVAPGDRVGVYLPRSAEAVVAFAAILDAGAAYVPLDPDLPAERVRRMVAQAGVRLTLTLSHDEERARRVLGEDGTPMKVVGIVTDAGPSREGSPTEGEGGMGGGSQPAYVMFTSGSTGEPKGVEIPHRGVIRLVLNNDFAELSPQERILALAPVGFDASTLEIWGALLNGGTLVMAPAGASSLGDLVRFIQERQISTLWLTAPLFESVVDYHLEGLAGVRQLLTGGDRVSPRHCRAVLERFPEITLVNGYGPTENTTFTCCRRVGEEDVLGKAVPIGRPIRNSTAYILDERGRLVPPGMVGELYAGGDGLATGYVNQPELTAERFPMVSLPGRGRVRLYRTGDMARHGADGAIDFLGRTDHQVKIRGHRVELGEVEATLRLMPGVAEAVAVAPGTGSSRRLRVVLVPHDREGVSVGSVREFMADRLPPYMVPSEVLFRDVLPTTRSGKVHRDALAGLPSELEGSDPTSGEEEGGQAPEAEVAPGPPADVASLREVLAEIWADVLGRNDFRLDTPFFDAGGDSLMTLRMVEELRLRGGVDLPVVRIFEFPTIRLLADHIASRGSPSGGRSLPRSAHPASPGPVAVVGMAGRFPGAEDVNALWRLLQEGRETVKTFSPAELQVSEELARRPEYVPVRGVLEDVESFDAAFFGMTPREAAMTDPQIRILLETAWRTFEDAGRAPGDPHALVGGFVGVSHNTYLESNILSHEGLVDSYGRLRVLFGNDKDYVASVLAHRLDLRGPVATVQTASSSSLTALAMAVQALRSGMCDMCLAGGASVTVPVRSGHLYEEGAMFSRDGHTRTFDARASGTVFSDGAAMVLLKRLDDAVRDGDRILAVIHGVGVTNDGAARASFTAPTVGGQALAISRALEDAGWAADTISYVEAHGTATPLGDPVEVEALCQAFRESTQRKRFCLVGSLKSNVGHLTAAAGVAGVIKTVEAMRHRWIPPTLHFETPNPAIDFEGSPFLVAREGVPWSVEDGLRRAGVSSFGAGGTNVHVVLEEWSEEAPEEVDDHRPWILPVSAGNEAALREQARLLAHTLEGGHGSLASVARTLQEGRRPFDHRSFVVGRNRDGAAMGLRGISSGSGPVAVVSHPPPGLVFLFAGQGAQYPLMGSDLRRWFPEIRSRMDACAEAFGSLGGRSLGEWLRLEGAAAELQRTELAQPALFALEFAVGGALMEWGVRPRALVGHSIGELSAACLAGVMDLETGARIVRERGRLMGEMPSGAMLAVRASPGELAPLMGPDLAVAARNAPKLTVVSGPTEAVVRLESRLEEEEVGFRRLNTSHAFHSQAMAPAAEALERVIAQTSLRPPVIPIVSTATGRPLSPEEAVDPAYWARQILNPVLFQDAVAMVAKGPRSCFLEVGPGAGLSTLVRQVLSGASVFSMGMREGEETDEVSGLLGALGGLWSEGAVDPAWGRLASGLPWRRMSLPGHPFSRRKHWVDPSRLADPGMDALLPGPSRFDDSGSDVPGGHPATPSLSELIEAQRRLIGRQAALLRRVVEERDPGSGRNGQ